MRRLYILGAQWCSYCREVYNEALKRFRDVEVAFIDIDEYPHLFERFRLRSYPSIAIVDKKLRLLEPVEDIDEIEIYLAEDLEEEIPVSLLKCMTRRRREKLDTSLISSIISRIEKRFDWTYGGLNTQYKLPPYNTLEFLLRMYLVRGVDGYLKMVHKTIDIILQSEIFDYSRGLISRMAFREDWEEPDKVYLVEDQARFARLLTWLYQILGNKIYLDIASMIVKTIFKEYINKGWFRAYIGDTPVKDVYPHIKYKTIAYLTDLSIEHRVRRYTVNLPKYTEDIKEVIGSRGYLYLGDISHYIDANLSLYRMFRWKRSLKNINDALKHMDILRHNGLFRDVDKANVEGLDNWICIPIESNLEIARDLIILNNLGILKEPLISLEDLLSDIGPNLEKDTEALAKYGTVLSLYLDGIDLIKVSGYRDIPYRVLQTYKPYMEILYVDEGKRYIEYISKNYRFRI